MQRFIKQTSSSSGRLIRICGGKVMKKARIFCKLFMWCTRRSVAAADAVTSGRPAVAAAGQLTDRFGLNHEGIVLCCAFQDCICGDLVIHDHGTPTGGVSLRADDGAEVNFTALFQYLKEDLHLTLIAESMQEKVVQDQKGCAANSLYALLVLHIVGSLERHKLLQQYFTVVVFNLVVVAGYDSQRFCQVGFAAVRGTQNAEIHAGGNEVQR